MQSSSLAAASVSLSSAAVCGIDNSVALNKQRKKFGGYLVENKDYISSYIEKYNAKMTLCACCKPPFLPLRRTFISMR